MKLPLLLHGTSFTEKSKASLK